MNDPLSYALNDEPVPDELASDPEFAGEYAKAREDIDAIKRGLGELAATAPHHDNPRAKSRWSGGVILAVAASTLLVLAVGGLGASFLTQNGSVANQTAGGTDSGSGGSLGREPVAPQPNTGGGAADLTEEGLVACATQIVDGVIEDILPGPSPQTMTMLLDVTRSYKPVEPAERVAPITVTLGEPVSPEIRVGAKAFLVISRFANEPPALFAGAERTSALQRFDAALKQQPTALPPCPGPG